MMRKCLKKGFTLIELLVVLMLMGLITTAVVMVLKPTAQIYADINNKADEETGSITLFDFINGDLRYATNVVVTSSDNTTMPGSTLKNFILLSNETRASSLKGARGEAVCGKTANPAARANCVSSAIYGENDFQFQISAYNTSTQNQSLTIDAICHPMKENSARNGFEINTVKKYTYSEGIQFVNMRYSSQVKSTIGGLDVSGYDGSKPYIWIFYDKPSDISGGATTPPVTNPYGNRTYNTKSDLHFDYGSVKRKVIVHMQSGASGPQYCKFNHGVAGITAFNGDGSAYTGGAEIGSGPDETTMIFTVDDATTLVVFNPSNAAMQFVHQDGATLNAGSSDKEVWIYDNAVHTTPYVPAGGYAEPKKLYIHYIYSDVDEDGSGIKITDADALANGSWKFTSSTGASGNTETFINSGENDMEITVNFNLDGAATKIYSAKNSGNDLLSVIKPETGEDEWTSDIIGPDEGDYKEVWVYNGVTYYSAEDCPVPVPLNKHVKVHYWKNIEYNSYGLVFADGDTLKNSSTSDRGDIADGGIVCYSDNGANFDAEITVIKEDALVDIYLKNQYNNATEGGIIYTINKDTPEEIWFYMGQIYTDEADAKAAKDAAEAQGTLDVNVTAVDLESGSIFYTMRIENNSGAKVRPYNFYLNLSADIVGMASYASVENISGDADTLNGATLDGNYAKAEVDTGSNRIRVFGQANTTWDGKYQGISIEPGQYLEFRLKIGNYWPGYDDSNAATRNDYTISFDE